MRVENHVKKIPYCDYFIVEEDWVCVSTEKGSDGCMVRQTLY